MITKIINNKFIIIILLLLIYLLGLFVRLEYRQFYENKHGKLPFTLESALIYRYALMIAEGKKIPEKDNAIQIPGGFFPSKHLSLGSDIITGHLYRILPIKNISFSDFLRFVIPSFFCLGIIAIFLITRQMTKSVFASVGASLFYAIAPSAIIRSTGIEFSRENFALPLLLFHFSCMITLFNRKEKKSSFQNLILPIITALLLACAIVLWDLSQFYFYIYTLFFLFLFLVRRPGKTILNYCYIQVLILIGVGLGVPYLREHYFITSFPMMIWYGLLISSIVLHHLHYSQIIKVFIVITSIIIFGILAIVISPYLKIYSHFYSLLLFKLRFFNIRPQNPALLPIEVRLLWTPALHSPFEVRFGFRAVYRMLPALITLLFFPLTVLKAYRINKKFTLPDIFFLIFLILSLILYVLFTRFEIFLICFISVFFGLTIYYSHFSRKFFRIIWYGILLLVLFYQANIIKNNIHYAGRAFYYNETRELITWIKNNTSEHDIFLATFGISPSILNYGMRRIILQPKFEHNTIRKLTIEYATSLFDEDIKQFYDFCLRSGANYYVYSKGTATDRSKYSWRYICDALDKSRISGTTVYKFEYNKNSIDYFFPVFENIKYIIYRILRPEKVRTAYILYKKGKDHFEKGDFITARDILLEALTINPHLTKAHLLLASIYKLFGYQEKAIEETKKALREIKFRRDLMQKKN